MKHEDILLEKINSLIEEHKNDLDTAYLRGVRTGIKIELHVAVVDGETELSKDELEEIRNKIKSQITEDISPRQLIEYRP